VPSTATIAAGQTQQFGAIASYNDETLEDHTDAAWWASSAPQVASVTTGSEASVRGLATTLAPGTTTITAGVGEQSIAIPATLTVREPGLTLTPTGPVRDLGESIQFQFRGTYADGTTRDLTGEATWSSSNPTVASITPAGLAIALAAGATTITATYGDLPSVTTILTVLNVPPTLSALIPSRGPVGMVVTLYGTHLAATSQVAFNGTPTPFTLQSATQVAATVPSGATSGLVTVTTPSGTGTSSTSFVVTAPPTVTITSPADGTTLTAASVAVTGTVTSDIGEITVSVNGVTAHVNGNQWAVTVPLQLGSNTLTATAVESTGAQATASIMVTANGPAVIPLAWIAIPNSGLAPLIVRWQVTNLTGRPLVQYELDANGTGAFGTPMATLEGVQTTYTIPGLVAPVVRATDDQGMVYTATTTVNVLPQNQIDGLIRAKWNGMKDALRGNAIEAAATYFLPTQQARYRTLFTLLGSRLTQVVNDMAEIEGIYVTGRQAQYRIQRTELVNGQPMAISYYIYFILGTDGVWRIRDF
jgi:hypothetical protein